MGRREREIVRRGERKQARNKGKGRKRKKEEERGRKKDNMAKDGWMHK